MHKRIATMCSEICIVDSLYSLRLHGTDEALFITTYQGRCLETHPETIICEFVAAP